TVGIRFNRDGSLRIRVTKDDLIVVFKAVQRFGIRKVVSVTVADWNVQQLSAFQRVRERRGCSLGAKVQKFADVLPADVFQKGARQQFRLGEYLKTVANADHESASVREVLHGLHHRRKLRERSGTQVIAVRKTSGQDHAIKALERGVLMPDKLNGS